MPINIEMPKLSDTMTEGTLVSWRKKAGDTVEIGDIIAEIETDKATMEMEAFDEGTIVEVLVEEGTKAPVGAVLAIIAEEDEDISVTTSAAAPVAASNTPAAAAAPHPPPRSRAPPYRRRRSDPGAHDEAAEDTSSWWRVYGGEYGCCARGPGGYLIMVEGV